MSGPSLSPTEREAIEAYFGSDADLYRAFRAACLAQFPVDVRNGDQAVARADGVALHHLVHSLKSVLLTLGHPDLSALACRAEQAVEAGEGAAPEAWATLRQALVLPFGSAESGPMAR